MVSPNRCSRPPRRFWGCSSSTPLGISMCGGIQPEARSVTKIVVPSSRSPMAHFSFGSWRATASSRRSRRACSMDCWAAAPARAPVLAAPRAFSTMPVGVTPLPGAAVGCWRTTAGWLLAAVPLAGFTAAESGAAAAGGGGGAAAGVAGRRSEP
ncbi:hypothetical protein BVC93_15880 [Mycobacterium sp. MS1601]|nr:hypothetical protein BVC93_15880 [Mycobacterium sp. MS1601]